MIFLVIATGSSQINWILAGESIF